MRTRAPLTTLSLDRYLPRQGPRGAPQALATSVGTRVTAAFAVPALERGASTRTVFERATSSVLDFERRWSGRVDAAQAKERSYLSDAMIDLWGRAERDATLERARASRRHC